MKPDYRHALGLALERGVAGALDEDIWRFYNAIPLPGLMDHHKQALVCVQKFRPDYLALKRKSYRVVDEFGEHFSSKGSLFLLGRSRKWNERSISGIWNRCGAGSRIVVAGNKTDGIQSIRKWFSTHFEITDSFSKHHAIVFWAEKPYPHADFPCIETVRFVDGYYIDEGFFSSDGPDAGSSLLAEYFDGRIEGRVADLGAGWGFLSGELLKQAQNVTEVDLFEADRRALDFAQKNMSALHVSGRCQFHWIDVTTEFPKKPYDWVIMNPPFHDGRAANPELGKRFIEVAASTLISGSRLLMVANHNLPYEKTLDKVFRRHEVLCVKNGFKVIEAVR